MQLAGKILISIERDISQTVLGSRMLGVSRTIMAVAQLSFIALTDPKYFFVPVGGKDLSATCSDKVVNISAYCISPDNYEATNIGMIVILLIVASGFAPRVTSVLHFWVSYSIASSVSLPDGGETTMQVMSLFIMIASLSDSRLWHWQRPSRRGKSEALSAVAWAGSWMVRVQIAYIYLHSGLAKLSVEQWADGTATYYVSRMEYFGSGGLFADVFRELLSVPLFALSSTWGTIVIEVIIAIMIVSNKSPLAKIALALSAFVHIWIALMIGIISFAFIMVASVMAAASFSICKWPENKEDDSDEEYSNKKINPRNESIDTV